MGSSTAGAEAPGLGGLVRPQGPRVRLWSAGDSGDGPGPRSSGSGSQEEPLAPAGRGSGRRYVLGGGVRRSRRRPKLDRPGGRGRGVGRPGRWAVLRATLAPGTAARAVGTHVWPLCDSERFRPRVLAWAAGPRLRVQPPLGSGPGAPSPRSEEGRGRGRGHGTGAGTGRGRAQDGSAPTTAFPSGAAAGTPRGSSRHRPEGGGSGAAARPGAGTRPPPPPPVKTCHLFERICRRHQCGDLAGSRGNQQHRPPLGVSSDGGHTAKGAAVVAGAV